MRYGLIVNFFPDKKFGFIRPDGEPSAAAHDRDVFFHVTALEGAGLQGDGECPNLPPDQAVKYELMPLTTADKERDSGRREPARRRAQKVVLIERLPGAKLPDSDEQSKTPRHRRARKKKPTWRR